MGETTVRKVLLVDDDSSVTQGLLRALRKEPYQLVTAQSGTEALQLLGAGDIAVVVSDEEMPDMRGTELLALVAKSQPRVLRMLMTGSSKLDPGLAAINGSPIYRFFSKPCNYVDLAITVRNALREYELVDAVHALVQEAKKWKKRFETLSGEEADVSFGADSDGAVDLNAVNFPVEKVVRQILDKAEHRPSSGSEKQDA